jgi:PPM family protein phosphatase
MHVQAASASDVGRVRTLNEDFCLVDPDLGLYVVCDGMGGHAAGEIASHTAAATVQRVMRENADLLAAIDRGEQPIEQAAVLLREAIEIASRTIFELGNTDHGKKGMGTTCCALLVRGGKGVMGHVGDSRLYLVRAGSVHQLSEDHTFVQEALKYGMLTPEQARQSEHHNVVTRAVGPLDRVIVDTLVFDLLVGDTLVLCSDGLHGYLGDARELPAWVDAGDWTALPKRLVAIANDRGGSDNITAIVVRADAGDGAGEEDTLRTNVVQQTFVALRHVELFGEMSMPELLRVASTCRSLELPAGQVVIQEGEATETLFVLVEGQVEVTRGGVQVATLPAGSHFGEMALLSRRPRSATVRTLEPSRLLALDRALFQVLLQQEPLIAGKFLWRLAQTLSLRLDDVYALHDGSQGRNTMRFGLYPSPFHHPAPTSSP